MKGSSVHMKVLMCKSKRKSSCASQKEVVVVWSHSKKYPSSKGWVQVEDIHGGRVIVHMKLVAGGLSIQWYRPKGGYKTSALAKKLPPGYNLLGSWSVTWKDGDKASYLFVMKGPSVHMKVLNCKARSKSTCASPKEVVVVTSNSNKYPSSAGWVQVEDIHGGRVIVHMKLVAGGLSIQWYRPKGGYKTSALAKKLPPGYNLLGSWSVTWKDGDKASYLFVMKGPSVHMKVLNCKARSKSTCASPKEVVVVTSNSNKYPSSAGWVQVEDIHGGRVIVHMKLVAGGLTLQWYRPKGGYKTSALAKKLPPGYNLLGSWSVTWKDGDQATYLFVMKGPAVHMKVLNCNARSSGTCASPKEVVVVTSQSKKYPSSGGWVQVSDIHGGRVIVYIKLVGAVLTLHWYRPKGGYTTTGTGKKFTPPPAQVKCKSGYIKVKGKCVKKPVACKGGYIKVKGKCVKKPVVIKPPSKTVITVFLKKMAGTFTIKGLSFKLVIAPTGTITIGGFKTHLVPSTSASFPGLQGWFKFIYNAYTYYIRHSGSTLLVNRFKKTCTKSYHGIKGFCGGFTGTVTTTTTVQPGGFSSMFVGKGFMFTSIKYPQRFMHPRKSQIWLDKFDNTQTFMKVSGFKIVKGLSGTGVSFQAGKLYLSIAGGKINLASGSSAAFKKSASFILRPGLAGHGGISFESVSKPGYYITESKYRVIVAKMSNSGSWKMGATWHPVKAKFTVHTDIGHVTHVTHVTHAVHGRKDPKQESESNEDEEEEDEEEDQQQEQE
jgi:hypothetical protein